MMFEEQLRKDIAKVIETGGMIGRRIRGRISFDAMGTNDYLWWQIGKHGARRVHIIWTDEGRKETTELFDYPSVANNKELWKLIKRILNPFGVAEKDDIPF